MRNMLALLAFVVLTFAGLGWYLGWYQIDGSTATSGNQKVNIEIDSKKILADVKKTKAAVDEMRKRAAETPAQDASASPPSITPASPVTP